MEPTLPRQVYRRARSINNTEATSLFAELVEHGLRNITFAQTRKIAELLYYYAQHRLRREHPELAERISAYRGGYLAEERRDIERRLFSGELLGVTATNALELGIDIGQLDATVLVGYPGPSPALGSRLAAPDAANANRSASCWDETTHWISISCAILKSCSPTSRERVD
jgi:DEAD/DEAH box helicase domain-containing protein